MEQAEQIIAATRRKRAHRPVSEALREFYTRRELLVVVPLCMATINSLEKAGIFPTRIQLTPTRRVVWRRREIEQFLEDRARNPARRSRATRR